MTEFSEDPQSRTRELERVVEGLNAKVATEREADGEPGNASDRESTVPRVLEPEPPD